jgi:hypothetical protein
MPELFTYGAAKLLPICRALDHQAQREMQLLQRLIPPYFDEEAYHFSRNPRRRLLSEREKIQLYPRLTPEEIVSSGFWKVEALKSDPRIKSAITRFIQDKLAIEVIANYWMLGRQEVIANHISKKTLKDYLESKWHLSASFEDYVLTVYADSKLAIEEKVLMRERLLVGKSGFKPGEIPGPFVEKVFTEVVARANYFGLIQRLITRPISDGGFDEGFNAFSFQKILEDKKYGQNFFVWAAHENLIRPFREIILQVPIPRALLMPNFSRRSAKLTTGA